MVCIKIGTSHAVMSMELTYGGPRLGAVVFVGRPGGQGSQGSRRQFESS